PRRPVEVVNARVRMIAATEHLPFEDYHVRNGGGQQAVIKSKRVYFDREWLNASIYDRAQLGAGDRLSGPAVVLEYSATTFVPPDSKAYVDKHLNLVIEVIA